MAAITENRSVRQRPEEGFRRWFLNEFFDIIIWYEYVSSGNEEPRVPSIATAILHGDAGPVPEEVLSRLERERGELDPDLLDTIITRAREFNRRHD